MEDFEKLIGCLNAIGFKPLVSKFEHRLVIQKLVYLLKVKGMNLGFAYGLYVRGPYSPPLATALFQNKKQIETLKPASSLSEKDAKIVNEFKKIFEINSGILEIAATYSYFVAEGKLNPIEALKKTKALKPFYSQAQVALGISRAKKFLFPPTNQQLKEMHEEFKAWESA